MSDIQPSVSVIIPARAATESLPTALSAIERQTYDNIVDVIVAAADAPSAEAARRAGATVIENTVGTTPAGLNLAIAASHGDVVIRCDAQAIFPPDYVEKAVAVLTGTGAANVGGMQVPIGATPWEKAIAAAMRSRLGAGDARYRVGGVAGPAETVYLGAFRRDALASVGGYDEAFGRTQDYELNHRLITAGETVWFDPGLKVAYRPRGSLRALGSQYFEYGRAKRQFARKHRGALRPRQLAPPLLVVAMAISLVLALVWPFALVVPLAYVVGLVAGSAGGDGALLRIVASLAVMHFAWGAGFLIGRSTPGRKS